MNPPKIHFKYAYPLDSDRRRLAEIKNSGPYPSIDQVISKTTEWSSLWKELDSKHEILKTLIGLTGVTTTRDLEVFIFGSGLGAMSSPLIIPITGKFGDISDDRFTEIIIHEIAHRFVGDFDNNSGIRPYWDTINKEYPDESMSTRNHIIIYAILSKILGKIYGDEKASSLLDPPDPEYQKAVRIVKERGADYLIEQFKSFTTQSILIEETLISRCQS